MATGWLGIPSGTVCQSEGQALARRLCPHRAWQGPKVVILGLLGYSAHLGQARALSQDVSAEGAGLCPSVPGEGRAVSIVGLL